MGMKGSSDLLIGQYVLGWHDAGFIKLLAFTSLLSINAAYAQQNEENGAEEAAMIPSLPTLTVSARGGNTLEDPRELPFGMTLVSGKEIEERGLMSVEDVLRATPGVDVNSSGGANVSSLYIRGGGALYPMSMDDTSVAVNLNGSPISSRHISLGNLDVESIDVLKGSQGTLFGGLAEAGAINITTRKPTRQLEGYLRGEYGQEGKHLVAGAFGGPLTDQLSGRIAIQQSSFDYPITNLQTGDPVSEPDLLAVRGSLMWDVTPDTSVLVSAERQKARYMGENIVLRPYGDKPVMDVSPDIYDDSHKTVKRSSLQIDHEFDAGQFTAVTSYTDGFNTSPVVYDRLIQISRTGNPNATEYWQVQESHERVLTQDLRLSSLPGADTFWVGGVSLLHSDRSYDNPRNTYGTSNAQFRDFTTKRYGFYGETTLPLARDWTLTAGLRHTWDSKTYDATYHSGGTVVGESESLDDHFITGRVGLTYALTPEVNVYSMFSRGYNPGGFQDYANAPGSASYRAATSESAELGFKYSMEDLRLTMNGALFYTDIEDNHLLSYDSSTYAVSAVNADTRSMGVELQASWQFDNGLTLSGDVSYIDSKITTDVFNIGDGDVHAGNRVPDVPRWSGHLALTYQRQISPFLGLSSPLLNARLDYHYQGTRPADPQNSFDLGAYNKIDMRLGLGSGNSEWYVWGRNLLDEHYDLYGYFAPPSTHYGAPAQGRVLGLGVNYTF
ncbi:TonB-dependent receptor [Marinobacterium iners]|uniref:Iron complex outermembrane recepter protein n=1 Tax=Marinobacterium iners DSM 11526 TaxID=1122198 RepID=A0A1H3XYU3_9GAMM|nr:TonB-dependent receptor [Marinobacterium iners]SEA03728.1 iron complex outermembrane recepter protein [Marinobacterium iners DSM 11526]